jgi:hexosaminidase
MIQAVPNPVRISPIGGEPFRLRGGIGLRASDPRLERIFERFLADSAADGTESTRRRDAGAELTLTLNPAAASGLPVAAGIPANGGSLTDEQYSLRLEDGGMDIEAPTPEGIFRGLTTLRQILAAPSVPNLHIVDGPRFAWRGLSLDTARTFFDVDTIKRVVDIMSLYKLNVLHLHLTDDQGWRVEVPAYPLLAEIGGSRALGDRPGGFYSVGDYAEIVAYAEARFVTVVPEIDMPGHCAAAISAYPSLAGPSAIEGFGSNLLDADKPEVATFVGEVLASIARATPGPYVHIGGDEAFGMDPGAYDRFTTMSRQLVRSLGKTPLSWQESSRSSSGAGDVLQYWQAFDPSFESIISTGRFDELELPDGISIPAEVLPAIAEHFRHGRTELSAAIDRGAKVILSPASHLYLDRSYKEPSVDAGQQRLHQELGLKVYERCSVQDSYDWEPGDCFPGHEAALAGVESAIWAETVTTAEELEFLLLPRLPGVAERAWSPAPGASWTEYSGRLAAQSAIWSQRTWTYFASSLVPW